MRTCEDHAFVVVYNGGDCPVCKIIDSFEDEKKALDEKISNLEDCVSKLELIFTQDFTMT